MEVFFWIYVIGAFVFWAYNGAIGAQFTGDMLVFLSPLLILSAVFWPICVLFVVLDSVKNSDRGNEQ